MNKTCFYFCSSHKGENKYAVFRVQTRQIPNDQLRELF